jgi:uncharacterized membrane protein
MAKTSTGLEENVASLLCYILGWVSGIIFLLLETENKIIRFHAIQSIIVFGIITIVDIFLWLTPYPVDRVLNGILWAIAFILWVVLMYKAYQGEKYKIPVAGDEAEKLAEKKNQS